MPLHGSSPTRILVVDDERVIADTMAAILRSAGFETAVSYSGEQALQVAHTFRPDILVADYSMPPGMDGIETSVQIKRMLPGLRVLMLSGQFLAQEFAQYKSKGYNFLLLSKPMHPDELLRAITAEAVVPGRGERHLRILNVDDVEEHRYSISRLLTHAGFEVEEAGSAAEALRLAVANRPDLVLLDIHLPDSDGYTVCAELKHNAATAAIPIMHVTSSEPSQDLAVRSAKSGADACFTYPMQPARMVKNIRELLQTRYLQQARAKLN